MILAQCPVCQELFSTASDCFISALPCGHVFHKHCVETWFKTSLTCPQCRVNVKRSSKIERLFFDVVPFPSFESPTKEAVPSGTPSSDCKKLSELRDPNVQLYRAREEIGRLEETLRQSERRLFEQTKLAKDRENEVATLTTLYTESDKLCEKERQRSRELRTELMTMRQFLREAEAMRDETIKLRAEMDDMQSIKKLISGSEEVARELFARYSLKPDTSRCAPQDTKCNLESLCRWTAVLRTELTSAREKARNYRIELSRLRKLHATAAQRAARSETLASQRGEQIQALEEQLSLALSRARPIPNVTSGSEDTPAKSKRPETLDSPDLFATPARCFSEESPKHRARLAGLDTPELLSLTPANCPSTSELQKRLRTPLENPFRAKSGSADRLELVLSSTIASALEDRQPSPETITSNVSGANANSLPTKPSVIQRRPSVLYEMSIMRRHLNKSSEPALLSNSHTVATSSLPTHSISHSETIHSRSKPPQKNAPYLSNNMKRHVGVAKTKTIGPPAGAKLSRLDNFIMRR